MKNCYRGAATAIFLLTMLPATPALAQRDNLAIDPKNVTTLQYGGIIREIWPSLGNRSSDKPREWQFRYEPLFVPQVDGAGTLVVHTRAQPNARVLLQIPILLDDPKARRAAF